MRDPGDLAIPLPFTKSPSSSWGSAIAPRYDFNGSCIMDIITISDLFVHLRAGLGPSAFNISPPPPCPAHISLDISLRSHIVPSLATNDEIGGLGINYSSVSKAIYAAVIDDKKTFDRPEELVKEVATIPFALGEETVQNVWVKVELPRAVLLASSVAYSAKFSAGEDTRGGTHWTCEIRDVRVSSVIGLHPHERKEMQRLEVDVLVRGYEEGWNHRGFTSEVVEYLQRSSSGTLEALADNLAGHLFSTSSYLRGDPTLKVTIRKPSALPFAIPSMTIERSVSDYTSRPPAGDSTLKAIGHSSLHIPIHSPHIPSQTGSEPSSSSPRAFVALGSNLGDRVSNIKSAMRMLEEAGCISKGCGRMYESEPMYVEDQGRFINSVVELETQLAPLDLLRLLKRTERAVGRTKTFANGPRVVDLDLLFFGSEAVHIGKPGDAVDDDGVGWLECPHPRIAEREFVLRPLADIAPEWMHPVSRITVTESLARVPQNFPSHLAKLIPLTSPVSPLRLGRPPKIMQIFNATPDSFSDGDVSHLSVWLALQHIQDLVDSPVPPTILDIGGMSTRPNSTPCSEDEEIARVVPLISAIRKSADERLRTIPISIDTYRPNVARAAVDAGASAINDVRGGRERGMLEAMVELDVPVVLMHSRGDSTSMMKSEVQDYSLVGGVVSGVRTELGEIVARALRAGVKGWNIIVDPGLGFAKSHADSLTLLRHLSDLDLGYPMLVGGSRKGFVGKITGREKADERGYGDAAVTAWCCQSGVDIVRVHEGRGMGEVVKMWEGIRDGA